MLVPPVTLTTQVIGPACACGNWTSGTALTSPRGMTATKYGGWPSPKVMATGWHCTSEAWGQCGSKGGWTDGEEEVVEGGGGR